MIKTAIDLPQLLDKMNTLQAEGDADVRAGNAQVAMGQQKQADARKIREAILVVLPDYKFAIPSAPATEERTIEAPSTNGASRHDSGDTGQERGYGYWTGMVYAGIEAFSGTASLRQVVGWVRKKPEHANANPARLKTSVRNALRSLHDTERIEKHKGPSGIVFTTIKANAR